MKAAFVLKMRMNFASRISRKSGRLRKSSSKSSKNPLLDTIYKKSKVALPFFSIFAVVVVAIEK